MTENPQREDGHVDIANEIVEALSRTNLSPYESRFLWCLFRKTYGWQKKADWIAVSQIVAMTGMHKAHISRAKRKLIERRIVTQEGNRIAFNKFYSQWRELPKQATVTRSGNSGTPVQVIDPPPKQADTKDNLTKDTFTKERPRPKVADMTIDRSTMETRFKSLLVERQWCDEAYADKTWAQGSAMDDSKEFFRKVGLLLAWANVASREKKAKLLYHEIAGFVNDKGAMRQHLTAAEQHERDEFGESVVC